MKKFLLVTLFLPFCANTIFSQTINYDIPFTQLNGMTLTSGDICSAPFDIEEAHQTSIGNTWGGHWTSINSGTATSVQIQLSFTVSDTISMYPTTLNGIGNVSVDPGPQYNCEAGTLLTWDLDPISYNSGGLNTFLIDYSASGIYNQVDNFSIKGGPFLKVIVTYVGMGIEDEVDYSTKELVRITDLLGRETNFVANKPLIYVYSDGSARRVLQIE